MSKTRKPIPPKIHQALTHVTPSGTEVQCPYPGCGHWHEVKLVDSLSRLMCSRALKSDEFLIGPNATLYPEFVCQRPRDRKRGMCPFSGVVQLVQTGGTGGK